MVASADLMRLGPGLAPALDALNITVMSCVPTLLSILDPGDEVGAASAPGEGGRVPAPFLPRLRLLICGGETLPQQLAERWSIGRALFNTYGPTVSVGISGPEMPLADHARCHELIFLGGRPASRGDLSFG